jgi:hypothetical protein
MALVQSQQFTGNGLRFVLRPLLFFEGREQGTGNREQGTGNRE